MIATWERLLAAASCLGSAALAALVIVPTGHTAGRVFTIFAGVLVAGVAWFVTSERMRRRPKPTLRRRLATIAGAVVLVLVIGWAVNLHGWLLG
jgi:drug/metabolite transporter superfamily protein YnfA